MRSTLFEYVSTLHAGRPWGTMLDAGTGPWSAQWVSSLDTPRWTGVTGSHKMADDVMKAVADRLRPEDRIVVGYWSDQSLLAGEVYDTVLADYLLGAIDGFTPYAQYTLFERLRPLVGNRLYVIGLEPYVPYTPSTPAGRIICEIGRLRDACLLLAASRPYREYPSDWTVSHLESAGYRIVDRKSFPIIYDQRFINGALDMSVDLTKRLSDRQLAEALQQHAEDLRKRALALHEAEGGLRHGADYVITAEPA